MMNRNDQPPIEKSSPVVLGVLASVEDVIFFSFFTANTAIDNQVLSPTVVCVIVLFSYHLWRNDVPLSSFNQGRPLAHLTPAAYDCRDVFYR